MSQPNRTRSDFPRAIKVSVAGRAAHQCSICGAVTVGPSAESPMAMINVGVAAHVSAAAPGGPRYDPMMSDGERGSIENAIWLCQTHAKLIDDDVTTWTVDRLRQAKLAHEARVRPLIGVPRQFAAAPPAPSAAREYAFARVRDFVPAYRAFLDPMLRDLGLKTSAELGILMCGSPPENPQPTQTPWTIFVEPKWLRWAIHAKASRFEIPAEIPSKHIYGQVPAWPDSFYDFLAAMVESDRVFEWQRHTQGYWVLAQKS